MLGPGTRIAGLRIDGLIGRGAMGEVFSATQTALKRPVAVKRIAEHLLSQPDMVARFEREAQCLARVHSPHVVSVHDFGRMRAEDGSEHYLLVMELVEGARSLRSYVSKPMEWSLATSLILQAAQGLAAAAEFGVVHRDIKPDNIILSSRGVAKLADFGLARSVDSTEMTMHGTVLGTPAYMAPEACRGEAIDGRGDIYSLGATWYQLLAGRTPFQAANTVAMLRCHIEVAPPPVADAVPGIPPQIAALVHRCLEKDRANRPQTAQELIDALRGLAFHGLAIPDTVVLDMPPEPTGKDHGTDRTNIAVGSYRPTEENSPTQTTPLGDTATAPTVLTAPETAPTSAPTRARRRGIGAVVAVAALALVFLGAWAALADGVPAERRRVDEALTAHDLPLASQLADNLLARHPDRKEGREAVHAVVAAQVGADLAKPDFVHARQAIETARSGRPWLDADDLTRDIDIAVAVAAAKDRRWGEAVKALVALHQQRPRDHAVCRGILAAIPPAHDRDRTDAIERALGATKSYDLYYEAGLILAEDPSVELDEGLLGIVSYIQQRFGSDGDLAKRARAVLIARHPASIADMHQALDSDNQTTRENAFLLLKDVGQLSASEEARYHARNAISGTSGWQVMRDGVEYLERAAADPAWPALRASAKIPAVTAVEAFDSSDEWSARVGAALLKALPDESAPGIAKLALESDKETVRWNAYNALRSQGMADRIDLMAFHSQNLLAMNPTTYPVPYGESFAFLRAALNGPDAAKARAALSSAKSHLEAEAKGYEENLHRPGQAKEIRDEAAKIADALAAKDASTKP